MNKRIIFFSLLFLITNSFAAPLSLLNTRLSVTDHSSRLVFDLTGDFIYSTQSLKNPDRFVIDVKNTQLTSNFSDLNFEKSFLAGIRTSKQADDTLRIVLDLKEPLTVNAFPLTPNEQSGQQYGHRLVIDLKKKPTKVTSVDDIDGGSPERDIVIVIDPGHGGKDPGAMGKNGTLEKDVVLGISKELKKLIDAKPGMQAVLTRDTDKYIGLRDRLKLARTGKADMYISVHADAFKQPKSRGASVFALSQHGASSEAAKWLAQKENYSELGGVSLKNKDNILRSVLIDLSQTATIGASLEVGTTVVSELGKVAKLHANKVEQAPFVVLKSPDIPSILVETGFISNQQEEKLLSSKDYQKKVASAVMKGVHDHFWQHPPHGTKFAASHKKEHVVAEGDNLSTIAKVHRVAVNEIKQLNQLTNDKLKIGQKLKIPLQV